MSSTYAAKALEALRPPITTFRNEEGLVSFYLEADFDGTKERKDLEPVGCYLYKQGLSLEDAENFHPPYQGFGRSYRNIRAYSHKSGKLTVNALYTQEESDLTWAVLGHPDLRIYVDFVDSSIGAGRQADAVNELGQNVQTIVLYPANLVSKAIAAPEDGLVTYVLTFEVGEVIRLPNDQMDLPLTP